jgi:putative inorganic carbon (hco3(-)) transporter
LGSIGPVRATICIRESSVVTTNWKTDAGVAVAALLVAAIVAVVDPVSTGIALAAMLVVIALGAYAPLGLLLAVVIALPFFYRPLQMAGQNIAASELLLLCLIPAATARLALDILNERATLREMFVRCISVLRERQVQVLVVLAVVGALMMISVADPIARSAGLREWRWTLLLPLVFVVFLELFARHRVSHLLLVVAFAISGAIAAAHGVMDVVTGSGVLADNVRRLSGPLPHPNALALFLVRPLVLTIAVSMLMPRLRPFMVPIALITGVATIGTFSRGALIAILAALAILALRSQPRTRYLLGASTGFILSLMFVLAGDRMRSALEGGSVSLRLDIWSASVRMIRDNPVIGYGPDQFLYTYSPRYILPAAWDERFTAHAHNLIADSWIRLGVVGAVIASGLLVFVVFHLIKSRSCIVEEMDFRYPALVTVAGVLVYGMIDNVYFTHDLAVSLWLLLWLAFHRPDSSVESHHE